MLNPNAEAKFPADLVRLAIGRVAPFRILAARFRGAAVASTAKQQVNGRSSESGPAAGLSLPAQHHHSRLEAALELEAALRESALTCHTRTPSPNVRASFHGGVGKKTSLACAECGINMVNTSRLSQETPARKI
jgi:hypothetical protein